jgi:dipeptidase E
VKLLLTSAGVSNPSIHQALLELLGKPIAQANALCIPTATYGHPESDPRSPWRFITGNTVEPMSSLGWKSVGVLELTALPSIGDDRWVSWVREADVLLVAGGDPNFLCHWMRLSGLADLLPTLTEMVYVGRCAGGMVLSPEVGEHFTWWKSPNGSERMLGMVDFSIFPHLNHDSRHEFSMEAAEDWARNIHRPAYVIDDHTAIVVTDGKVKVVSEGHWKLFMPSDAPQ